jgi:hypothetical protein
MADKLSETVGERMEDLLACWAKRKDPSAMVQLAGILKKVGIDLNVNVTDQTYPLAWEMIATIRDLKMRCQAVFETTRNDTTDMWRDFIGRTFDAIADGIADEIPTA